MKPVNLPYERRMRMLSICDGIPDLALLMENVNNHRLCDPILRWCVDNRQTGQKLLATWKHDCAGSPLLFIKRVVASLEGTPDIRPVIAGRDWLTR